MFDSFADRTLRRKLDKALPQELPISFPDKPYNVPPVPTSGLLQDFIQTRVDTSPGKQEKEEPEEETDEDTNSATVFNQAALTILFAALIFIGN